ncbi:anthranilate synthase component I family protein [Mongoliitalea daihaiensis]|nr:anthranilate synthase component I family protein [Mongoliitalea daihaiensis]
MFQIELPESELQEFFFQAIAWCTENYPYVAGFDGNSVNYPQGTFPKAIYAGSNVSSLEELSDDYKKKVGIISYDLKNQLEKLSSSRTPLVEVPDTLFFEVSFSLIFNETAISMDVLHANEVYEKIRQSVLLTKPNPKVSIQPLTSREKYIENVHAIRQHIEEGDMYELNYCLAYTFVENTWNPILAFKELMHVSPMPFSVFFKAKHQYLLGASPERFLKKEGDALIAQPIKGTIRRGKTWEEDSNLASLLLNSEKERAENLMIVDLMRNDLSKISKVGSVKVEELFGVYPFPRVHQMISTVTSTIKDNVSIADIFQATFPMGSMTGAPKIKCMELIDRYEDFRRGWFSGSVGIFQPNGDFDLNVIIRSIIYDQATGKGYFAVGSAITYDADPAYEYEECQLKASAIRQILE